MKPNRLYYERLKGEWDWRARFSIADWRAFRRAPLSVANWWRFFALICWQVLAGDFHLQTRVEPVPGTAEVRHSTRLTKWGVTALRSEKTFTLEPDGYGLLLSGTESYWPHWTSPVRFEPGRGRVDRSARAAVYEMPLLGTRCACETRFEPDAGEMRLSAPWMSGVIVMDARGRRILAMRFEADAAQSEV